MSGFSDSKNKSYGDDQQSVADILSGPGAQGTVTVGTAALELKVGASVLPNRKLLTIVNTSNNTIYWGWTSGVTISNGTPIFKNQSAQWSVSETASVWAIAGSAGNVVRITEVA